jgi:hypothetical protein
LALEPQGSGAFLFLGENQTVAVPTLKELMITPVLAERL